MANLYGNYPNKKRMPHFGSPSFCTVCREELFLLACVSLIEFVNAACGVNEFHLTGVEWVRCVGNLEFHYWVFNTFNLNGLSGVGAGTGDEHLVI